MDVVGSWDVGSLLLSSEQNRLGLGSRREGWHAGRGKARGGQGYGGDVAASGLTCGACWSRSWLAGWLACVHGGMARWKGGGDSADTMHGKYIRLMVFIHSSLPASVSVSVLVWGQGDGWSLVVVESVV